MEPMVSRAARVMAFVIATTFGWSLWSACVEGSATNAQMACCKDGELRCAAHGGSSDCCRSDGAPSAVIAAAKAGAAHPTLTVAWIAQPMAFIPSVRFHRGVTSTPPRFDPGPPPYIAYSSLLI
jgi:hypothetical protein